MAVNLICYFIVINAVYILTARMNLACVIGIGLTLQLATANHYVFQFKGTELAVTDFLAIRTAANVISHYKLKPNRQMLLCWGIWLAFSVIALQLKLHTVYSPWITRGIACAVELLLVLIFLIGTRGVKGTHWSDEGSQNYGYLLNFMLGVKGIVGLKPKGYRWKAIGSVSERFEKEAAPSGGRHPDVIVIMNESFADLSVLGKEPETNVPAIPFFKQLNKNVKKGFALASIFGGTTANSEYEFLTGNTMAFFPYGSVPYQQYIHKEAYSLVSDFHRLGYRCMATHPYLASGWSRPVVYPAFGFDRITFDEAYPKEKMIRCYISDEEMYNYIIRQYEALSQDEKLFLFGVTVQNHGGYSNRSAEIRNTVVFPGAEGKYPEAEQYLSLLRLSDQAIEKLISYFSAAERGVVLCIFGDHLPGIEPELLQELHDGPFQTLGEQQKTRMVPFCIWANYPIEEEQNVVTSLNYLGTHLLETAGIALPPFRRYLKELEAQIPAINAEGYYSETAQAYRRIDEATGKEAELLQEYRALVYNSAVDQKHRNRDLFPTDRPMQPQS